MTGIRHQTAHLPGHSLRSGTPAPTLAAAPPTVVIAPMPPPVTIGPAILRPVDHKQHGQYHKADHDVASVRLDPQPSTGFDREIANAFLSIITNSPDEPTLRQNLDRFAHLVKQKNPDSLASGMITGACARCGQMLSSLGQLGHSFGESALIIGAVVGVVAAQAFPAAAAPLNLTLFLIGGKAVIDGARAACQRLQSGDTFEAGHHLGTAVVEAVLTASSGLAALKSAKSLPGAAQIQRRFQAIQPHIKGTWGAQLAAGVAKSVNDALGPLASMAPAVAAGKALQGAGNVARLARSAAAAAETMDGAQTIRQLAP